MGVCASTFEFYLKTAFSPFFCYQAPFMKHFKFLEISFLLPSFTNTFCQVIENKIIQSMYYRVIKMRGQKFIFGYRRHILIK